MHPREALELLESVRPGTADHLEPEAQEALRAIEAQTELSAVVARRQEQDREIGRAVRDVPVPDGARLRLIERLAIAAAAVESPVPLPAAGVRVAASSEQVPAGDGAASPVPLPAEARSPSRIPHASVRRRWARRAVAAAACLLIAAIGASFAMRNPGPGTVALERVRTASPQGWDEFPAFAVGSAPAFSGSYAWLSGPVKLDEAPRMLPVEGATRVRVAAYRFHVYSRGKSVVDGWLAAVPASQVSDPPEQEAFGTGDVRYHNGLATVAWREGDTVFVCFVRGNDAALRVLERALGARAA